MSRIGRVVFQPPSFGHLLARRKSSVAAIQTQLEEARPYEEIPGPKPLPLIGNTWRFLPFIGEFGNKDMNEMVNFVRKKYGKIVKISDLYFNNDIVYIFDPTYIATLFRNEGQWPMRPGVRSIPYYRGVLNKDFFKGIEGVLFTQGKQWHDFRTRVNQTMMQPRSSKLYVGPIDEVAKDVVERMKSLRNLEGEMPPDFLQHLMRWALESISVVALDTRLGCLDPDLKPDSETQKMIDAVHSVGPALFELDIRPSLIPFTRRKQWKALVKALDIANEVALKYIRRSMERIKNKVENDEREMSVLETLLIKNEDPLFATVMALDMMLAGIDTTSNAAATVLHFLAINQDKQEKLFTELQSILPLKEQPITAQKLEDMKYLKACIKESLRLSPITSGTARETQKDIVIGNYVIRKGAMVVVPSKYLSVSEEYFQNPDQFRPERWLKGSEEQEKVNPFVALPFGFGPRMCVGRRFAELEIETLLARIIRNFRLEYDEELVTESSIINVVVSPLNFKTEDRP